MVPVALPLTAPLVAYEKVLPVTVIGEPPVGVLKLPLAPLTWTCEPLVQPEGMPPDGVATPDVVEPPAGVDAVV